MNYLKKFLIGLIRIYQKTISPDHSFLGGFFPFLKCRFYPSCSEYMIQTIEMYGIRQGLLMGFKRILRCHPWNKGGVEYPNS